MKEKPDKKEAQEQVDHIHIFRQQLAELTQAGVLELSSEQQAKLDAHLNTTLADLAARFDVDTSEAQKRYSLGMRIVSTLGGLAFCAALILFFNRYWGYIPTPVQVGLAVSIPILGLILVEFLSRRDKTSYYTSLLAIVVLASFILNLSVLGSIFNLEPTSPAFLAWGSFALILAYGYNLRLPLLAGLVCGLVFVCAVATAWTGGYWPNEPVRPENLIIGGLLILAASQIVPHRKQPDFPLVFHLTGLASIFISLLILMHWGELSRLPMSVHSTERIYRILAFLSAGLAIWLGIRFSRLAVVNISSAFFAVFLFDRLIAWWWDWMPKYLFFLSIGLIAVALLAAFQKLRFRTRERMA